MADFKLCISDPKDGKSYQKEVKDEQAKPFIGLNIGETINGEIFGAAGFEFKVTGGSDYCGFPMRSGILGVRKRIAIYGGVGFSGKGRRKKTRKGMKKRKTICGHKINEQISQINLVVSKAGAKKLNEVLGIEAKAKEGAKPAEEAPKKAEEKPKGEKRPEKPAAEAKKEEKPEKEKPSKPSQEAAKKEVKK